jgi:hypothetical protein
MLSYLFVIPVYLLVLAAAVAAGIVCRFIPNARHASAYFFAGAVGSVPGMIIPNLILILVVVSLAKNAGSYPEGLRISAGATVEAGAILGPFLVSAVGVAIGAGIACFIVRSVRKRRVSELPPVV